jgi:hypothetical protein
MQVDGLETAIVVWLDGTVLLVRLNWKGNMVL